MSSARTSRGRRYLAAVATSTAVVFVSTGCSSGEDDVPGEPVATDVAEDEGSTGETRKVEAESTYSRSSLEARSTVSGDALGGETTLERRAIELFSDYDATSTEAGTTVEVDDEVLFDFDDDQVRPNADDLLDDLAELAELTEDVPILVRGHTDGLGTDAYNLDLSQRRAEAVVAALVDRGVAPGRLSAEGLGSQEPVAEEGGADDEAARARNRRVEVVFEGIDLDG